MHLLGYFFYVLGMRVLSLVIAVISTVEAWNHEGHKIAARVAASLLTKKTARFVRRHLFQGPVRPDVNRAVSAMVNNAAWADFVPESLEWSRELHFSHTPYRACAPFLKERDCGFGGSGRCLVTGIANFTAQAADPTVSSELRAEALRFLIHLVVDAHSPMHVGFAEDFGGNTIDVLVADESVTLHEIWDDSLIQRATAVLDHDMHWASVARHIMTEVNLGDHRSERILGDAFSVEEAEEFAAAIVSETATQVTCAQGYTHESGEWINKGDALESFYLERGEKVALAQMRKAGIRLAQLLEVIAAAFYRSELRAIIQPQSESFNLAAATLANPFAPLGVDLDLEELLYEVDADPVASEISQVEFEDAHLSEEAAETPKTPATRSMAAKNAARNRSVHEREKVKRKLKFGLEMDSIVLLKRGSIFYITHRSKVNSDTFVPGDLILVKVKFEGLVHLVPFRMDNSVFRNDYTLPRMRAIFEHLAEGVAFPRVETVVISNGFSKGPPPTFEPKIKNRNVPLSEVAGFIAQRPSKFQLKALYPGTDKFETLYAADLIKRQLDDLILVPFRGAALISTREFLSDPNQRRFVLNRFGVLGNGGAAAASSEASYVYIDTRVSDEPLTGAILKQIKTHMASPRCIREVQAILKSETVPIVSAMIRLSEFLNSGFQQAAESYLAEIVESINTVVRTDRPGLDTKEFILKP